MAIRVALNHVTHYKFDRAVGMSPHIVRLRPAPHARTPIHAYSLRILPEPHFLNWQQDPYSNYLARLVFPEKATELRVEVDLVAEMTVINPFDFFIDESAEKFPFAYDPAVRKELQPYLETFSPGVLLKKLIDATPRSNPSTINHIVDLNMAVHRALKYLIRMEPGVQSPEETLTKTCGSCRDFAWLLVHLLRHHGLAARFVSGYLIQLTADVKSLDGPSGPEKDFTDLHAWAEVYLPGAGWIGLDATSGLLTGEGHIPLACTAEPLNAAPVSGATDECKVDFHFSMTVRRIHEDPRVTKPYTPEQWGAINALGHEVDTHLKKHDVRLTMGGEPTFVSIDNMDGAEWNFTAVGPDKRRLSGELLDRLRDRFAPGGFLHFGLGKWYPGEPLPRFALSCYWRHDGEPIWRDASLVADANEHAKGGHVRATAETAQRFVAALAGKLGVDPGHAIPAYEDVVHYLVRERRLPVNVDPSDSKLGNAEDRKRLAKVFEQGLGEVIGYILPLHMDGPPASGAWQSSRWELRSERLYLVPGDSPIGLRLPLESLPWVPEKQRPKLYERDPLEELPALPKYPLGAGKKAADAPANAIRTALCVEPRDGILHLFMPPLRAAEDYLDLVTRIELVAAALDTAIIIEGYAPPHDPRINVIKVTPDPGVIEVNVHPVHTWGEAVGVTEGLYDDAHHARLGTEKFMLDGRHSGTGGGNHIVMGGPTAADSPFLRRADLLKSLVAYWHNHPSLSYLFSGMFIGPTSQAPRADEGRTDNTYELEIALSEIPLPSKTASVPPWLVDRVFRNLLTDLTGNTHRAEFCIDKLYSPDSATGRLGLLEFRGFEMPPHPQMSLTQQLLLRALVAHFWQTPYDAPLVRWRTDLHDRFMLPHFVAQDFAEVLRHLDAAGFPIEPAWFFPHMEFRFPVLGELNLSAAGGVHLELRQAIEPWYVLGEEPAGGTTARYVDSSVERMQLKVTGLIGERHMVAVNGVKIPLHSTGQNGEYVAGIRYRAWQPPHCLHPTIPVHSPLVFDVVDSWNKQAVGGCTYHVSHPGGRATEQFPVNAFEAEGRRVARFFKFGHTPGPMELKIPNPSPEYPFTLDLRRI